ncbi:hypothetical protein UlMin_039779 [Ulmus minor]
MEEEEEASKLPLPEAFVDFLEANGLDPSLYSANESIPRYIRLKPGCEAQLEEIEAQMNCKLEKVGWLPGFYSLPPNTQIANSKVYGIDASSGAAVLALDISPAPGAKLCLVLNLLGEMGSVTGVDVSRHRLAACRTMIQKYESGDCCRLFVADGTSFSLTPIRAHPDSKSCDSILGEKVEKFKEWTSRRTWKERKQAARAREKGDTIPASQQPELIFYGKRSGVVGLSKDELYQTVSDGEMLSCGYDKVLVDAECTHDGSIKHIQKFEHWGWKTLQRRVLDAERTDSLTVLQLKLLTNGFRLLKAGGLLVYSTCSLTVAQNEDVVEQFLKENASAELQDIETSKSWPCRKGSIPKTLRFDPLTSQTSGLFVAKFSKTVTY